MVCTPPVVVVVLLPSVEFDDPDPFDEVVVVEEPEPDVVPFCVLEDVEESLDVLLVVPLVDDSVVDVSVEDPFTVEFVDEVSVDVPLMDEFVVLVLVEAPLVDDVPLTPSVVTVAVLAVVVPTTPAVVL